MADSAIKDLAAQDVSYNGVEFGQLTSFHIRAAPEYDRARRTTVNTLYTLSVRSIQYSPYVDGGVQRTESALGNQMLTVRQKLLEAGKPLIIRGIGFGDTATNGQGRGTAPSEGPTPQLEGLPDIVWGPQPREAKFQPLGGGVCYQLDWVCDFRLNECTTRSAVSSTGRRPLMAFNYDVTYSNDEWGFTTRMISGTAMIPQPRSGRVVTNVPLDYRDSILVSVPRGYRRIRNEWGQNAAQNELTFLIVDEQLKTEAPPTGIAKAEVDVSLSARSDKGGVFPAWILTVAGTMETLPGFPKSWAAARFFAIVASYVRTMKYQLGPQVAVLPVALDMRFGAFGRASQFNAAFYIPAVAKRNPYFIGSQVLYSPLPDASYDQWVGSTYGFNTLRDLWSSGGQSKLTTPRSDIVDLCASERFVEIPGAAKLFPLSGGFPDSGPAGYYSGADITPQNSYIAYAPEMTLERDDRKVVNKRDVTTTITLPTPTDPKASMLSPSTSYPKYQNTDDKVTACGVPEQTLCFAGRAVRVGYEVSIPQISAINGVKLDWLGGSTDNVRGPSMIEGVPMYYGSWEHYYRPQGFLRGDSLSMPHPHFDV